MELVLRLVYKLVNCLDNLAANSCVLSTQNKIYCHTKYAYKMHVRFWVIFEWRKCSTHLMQVDILVSCFFLCKQPYWSPLFLSCSLELHSVWGQGRMGPLSGTETGECTHCWIFLSWWSSYLSFTDYLFLIPVCGSPQLELSKLW